MVAAPTRNKRKYSFQVTLKHKLSSKLHWRRFSKAPTMSSYRIWKLKVKS